MENPQFRQRLSLCIIQLATCFGSKTVKIGLITNKNKYWKFVFFLLGDSKTSEFYVPKFQNTLSVPSSQVVLLTPPMKIQQKRVFRNVGT